MESESKRYIAIDLKSFYASVECIERGLDPLDTYLVVADLTRTEKTICLAVTPTLKSYGIPGRVRMFELISAVNKINEYRQAYLEELYKSIDATGRRASESINFTKKSVLHKEVVTNPSYKLDYIVAPPQMAKYLDVSTKIYGIYLDFIAPEDIHVYSIDEVFIDATPYLKMYNCDAETLARKMIKKIYQKTGITATAGIGSNLYLAKIAMDVLAKKMPADKYGVRVANLDQITYRKLLWNHRPISDFWMIGAGYTRRLKTYGMHTMGDIARCSVKNEDLLYEIFGINAELLIDHAWGYEPCKISDIRHYKPVSNSLSHGQVLHRPYSKKEASIVIREMAEHLSLDLVSKNLVTKQVVMHIGYDIKNLLDAKNRKMATSGVHGYSSNYKGGIKTDIYGRKMPKYCRSTINLPSWTCSAKLLMEEINARYNQKVDSGLLIRRINITATNIIDKNIISDYESKTKKKPVQLNLFTDYKAEERKNKIKKEQEEKELELEKVILDIKNKFGKNLILRGLSLEDGATAKDRNAQIGGHAAGAK